MPKKVFLFIISVIFALSQINTALTKEIEDNKQNSKQINASASMMDLNSEKLEYFPEENKFIATGEAEVFVQSNGARLRAEKITFDPTTQMMTAEKNVRIIKQGSVIKGDFVRIDMTKESAIIDNPNTVVDVIKIKAKTANVYGNNIEALQGSAVINEKLNLMLSSYSAKKAQRHISSNNSSTPNKKNSNYRITTKEIIVKGEKHRNIITLKNANIFIGKIKVAYIPVLEITTDKEMSQIETMLPEIGHTNQMGYYAGPSKVFHLPKGHTLKTSPLLAFGDGVGYGGFARITSPYGQTEVGYTSTKKNFVLQGEIELSESNKISYGSNAYVDDGFMGRKMPEYIAEFVHRKEYLIEDINVLFTNRLSAGYAQDFNRDWGTGRYKAQGNFLTKNPLFTFKDLVDFRLNSQYDVTIYGTGDTTALIRIGPYLSFATDRLYMHTAYYQSGLHGETPFFFDKYYYGKSNWVVGGEFVVNSKLTLGYYGSLNLTKDNWDEELLAENQIYTKIGPDDFKFRIGYDTVREQSVFGVDFLVGAEKTALEFDKMKLINPGELNKPKKKDKRQKIKIIKPPVEAI